MAARLSVRHRSDDPVGGPSVLVFPAQGLALIGLNKTVNLTKRRQACSGNPTVDRSSLEPDFIMTGKSGPLRISSRAARSTSAPNRLAAEIVEFASEFDPQPMHLDEQAGKASILGGLSASGWHTCGMFMRMLCDAFLLDRPRKEHPEYQKWKKPVLAGDRLSAALL